MEVKEIKAFALVKNIDKDYWKAKLTIRSKGNKPFTIKLYEETDDGMWIPRTFVSDLKIPVTESKDWYIDFKLESKIKLRPEQVVVKNEFLEALNTHSPYGGIIEAKTGFGKTFLGIDLLATIGGRSLIIVPTTYLLEQWKERLIANTNLTENDIGLIRQNICIVDKPVVIGMLHSLAMKDYPKRIYGMFHNVLIDEIHKISTEVFSRITPKFHAKYFIGCSATPRRKDGTENVFKYCIGNVVAQSRKIITKPKVIAIAYKGADTSHNGCVYGGELKLGRYLNKIEKSYTRNKLITELILKLYNKNKDILVLSDRLKLLYVIENMLIKNNVKKSDIGYLTGNRKVVDRKIILGTYGSAGLGADIPRLNALIFATPRTDIEQPFGRITRCFNGNATVIDIIDTSSNIMLKWFLKRMNFYRKFAEEVVRVGF